MWHRHARRLGFKTLTRDDLEWLGLERLDISPSAAMATATTFTGDIENDPATTAALESIEDLASRSPGNPARTTVVGGAV